GALAGYERTVLRALEETENALVAHARNRERLELLAGTVDATRRAAGFAELRYEGGASDFLDVLDAQRAQLEAEDRYVQARLETAAGLVALYKALGGGWGSPDAPTRTATR
ncbi:TolC family protein, partial [Algiphilus sp.]|uniref:TolC family protein n=1 Tax=Algiphilus sp. TaxID=1872431 RepID=UPI003C3E527E